MENSLPPLEKNWPDQPKRPYSKIMSTRSISRICSAPTTITSSTNTSDPLAIVSFRGCSQTLSPHMFRESLPQHRHQLPGHNLRHKAGTGIRKMGHIVEIQAVLRH